MPATPLRDGGLSVVRACTHATKHRKRCVRHSLTHSLIQSLTYSLTHSLTQVHLCDAAQRADTTVHLDTARV